MDNELFELCKTIYEKTNWDNDLLAYLNWREIVHDEPRNLQVSNTKSDMQWKSFAPLYTSDYLLEKLPGQFGNRGSSSAQCLRLCKSNEGYMAGYIGVDLVWWLESTADTPLKALLKLTLALHEAGELQPARGDMQ